MDNGNVEMINRSIANNKIIDAEESERDREEYTSVIGDIELQSPVAQTPQTPVTGQQTAQQLQTLFPFDTTSIAAAQRRERG